MTSDSVPYCSKCDALMIQRMDMETARYFWDCPQECIGTKPRKTPRRNRNPETKPVSEVAVMTNAAGALSSALYGDRVLADGSRYEPPRSTELEELDRRMAEVERKIAAKKSAALYGEPVKVVAAGETPPSPVRDGAIYYDSTRNALLIAQDDGKPLEIASANRRGCPAMRQNADGSSSLCGREPEVLGGVEHKDGLCWLHAAPTDPHRPTAERASLAIPVICSLLCGAAAGVAAYLEAGPDHYLAIAGATVGGLALVPLLFAVRWLVKRPRAERPTDGVSLGFLLFMLLAATGRRGKR